MRLASGAGLLRFAKEHRSRRAEHRSNETSLGSVPCERYRAARNVAADKNDAAERALANCNKEERMLSAYAVAGRRTYCSAAARVKGNRSCWRYPNAYENVSLRRITRGAIRRAGLLPLGPFEGLVNS